MDQKDAVDLASRYAAVVVKEMNPDKVILYGSYAKGMGGEESDIDVAVIFTHFTGDWFQTYTRLSSLRRRISSAIEPVLLDSAADRSGFVDEVMQHGELLYPQEDRTGQ